MFRPGDWAWSLGHRQACRIRLLAELTPVEQYLEGDACREIFEQRDG